MATATKTKQAQIKFTDAEVKDIHRMLSWTWSAIAGDLFNARSECGEEGDMPVAEVIECTLDANYLEQYGPRIGSAYGVAATAYDNFLIAKFRTCSYEQMKTIAKGNFKFKRYGY